MIAITSAHPLTQAHIAALLKKHALTGETQSSVDHSLVGGYVIEYDGIRIDHSIRARIQGDSSAPRTFGIVTEVKDGIVVASHFIQGTFGEVVVFETGARGVIVDLTPEHTGIIVFGEYTNIRASTYVFGTGAVLQVPVGDLLVGHVLDALGNPIDGSTLSLGDVQYPVEKIAPGIVARKSVTVPLQTGIKSIDALVPIGRGQRELIIGDRGTGKTTLCIDTIINQKDQNVTCVYCAIGQKSSKIAATVETLRSHGALAYTIVVASNASDSPGAQYIAPYTATAIAEYFMDKGKDVLIVYDDLTKHAWAYRTMSLILRRPAGREAYPGDVFYLHSRLLERACRLDESNGGGSLTALPIIETLENDVSAYIPTNVISITDGQIFLETDLFNAGMRPAINIGLSVSRVGSAAQTKAMKSVAGKLKLDLAQYRELAAFAQFASDLDIQTKKFLDRGARASQLLKQDKQTPYRLAQQVAVFWALNNGYLDSVSIEQVTSWEQSFVQLLGQQTSILDIIEKTNTLEPSVAEQLRPIAEAVALTPS